MSISDKTNTLVQSIDSYGQAALDKANANALAIESKIAKADLASTNQLPEGVNNLYFTVARVRAVLLTGLNLTLNAAVAAGDTLIVGISKLQSQVTAMQALLAGKLNSEGPATFTGDLTVSSSVKTKTYTYSGEHSNGLSTAAKTIVLRNGGVQTVVLNAATVDITIDTALAAIGYYQIMLMQDATGGRVVTFTGIDGTRWLGAVAQPDINVTPNGETLMMVYWNGVSVTQTLSKVGAE